MAVGDSRRRYRDDLLDQSRSPYFRTGRGKRVGTFIVTPTGRRFHLSVTCKEIRHAPDLSEVDIVEQGSRYYRAGSLSPGVPCTVCNPLTAKQLRVEPLGSTDIPCKGRDREWVRSFQNRKPAALIPAQVECVKHCTQLEKCYQIFLVEQPEYGVLGGVTIQQYREWGPNALAMVKELVAVEDTQENEPTSRPGPERRG